MDMEARSADAGSVHVLLGVSGSVAAIKAREIVHHLRENASSRGLKAEVRIVPTFRGATFVPGDVDAVVVSDDSEWDCWRQRHDPIAHIETCIARAWDFRKPLIVCPAMNCLMWSHPVTNTQLKIIESFGAKVISPIEKRLMCGDEGYGAMAEPQDVARLAFDFWKTENKTGARDIDLLASHTV